MPAACAAFDRGLHLLVAEGLLRVDVIESAHRTVHFDHVGPGSKLALHGLHHLFGRTGTTSHRHRRSARPRRTPAGTTAGGDSVSAYEHARSQHRAAVNQIPHSDIRVFLRAQISNRGHARFERLARILLGEENGHCRHAPLTARPRAWRAVPIISHMRVDIDQAGQSVKARPVDHLGTGRRRSARGDAAHASPLDYHQRTIDYFCAIPELSQAYGRDFGIRGVHGAREKERQQ